MRFNVFDLGSRYLFPSLRRRLVEIRYREYGLNQMKIAGLLNITQSAVSRYLRMGRGGTFDVSRFGDIDARLRSLARRLVEGVRRGPAPRTQ